MKTMSMRVAALKPRNVFASLAKARKSGTHKSDKRVASEERKDLLQRLRESGL